MRHKNQPLVILFAMQCLQRLALSQTGDVELLWLPRLHRLTARGKKTKKKAEEGDAEDNEESSSEDALATASLSIITRQSVPVIILLSHNKIKASNYPVQEI